MPRQEEQRNLNRRRNQSFDRDYQSFDDRGIDSDFDLRGGRNSDYYSNRDEERRFGMQNRGWGQESDRSSDYGRTGRMNDWGTRDYGSTRYGSADRYGENIGNQGFSGGIQGGMNRSEERGRHFGKGPKGWKRSDERIKEEACEALYRDSEVDASGIDVSVEDGCVCLRGTVESRQAKRRAEECVENLSGVDDVRNELRVNRESTTTNIDRQTTNQTNLS